METALGPSRYHDRMPFFGSETGTNSVTINGCSQYIMDKEISYATQAGLDYWAFVGCSEESAMTNALKLYLSSACRNKIRFCMIGSMSNGGQRGNFSSNTLHELAMMSEAGYIKVLDDRPLYFVLAAPEKQIEVEWGGYQGVAELFIFIRAATKERRLGNPYIVLLGSNPALAIATGCDAIGNYAVVGRPNQSTYKQLVDDTKARWEELASSPVHMVPTAMTGWDQRPLIENPPFWDLSYIKKGVGLQNYYARASPEEIAAHMRDAISWTERHRDAWPAGTVLIYAWNECAEGFGALVPTYRSGDPLGNHSRLDAISAVLH